MVSRDKSGAIKVNQDEVDLASLSVKLQDIFKTRNDRTIFVNGDPDLLFDDVIKIIDIAKGAGIDKVGLMTEQIRAQ